MTVAWKEELLASRKVCKKPQPDLVSDLLESKRKLAKQIKRMGIESNWQANNTANQKLTNLFYSNWLGSRYPVVDLSFADTKFKVLIERTSEGARIVGLADREPVAPREMVISIPKYAKQVVDGDRRDLLSDLPDPRHRLAQFIFSQFQQNRERFRTYQGTINCNRPAGAPKSLRRKFCDVMAISLEAKAAATRAGVAISDPSYGRTFLWEPRFEDLYIQEVIQVKDDPAVIVNVGDRAHLIAFWESPEEGPLEGVLREFTEGSLESVVD